MGISLPRSGSTLQGVSKKAIKRFFEIIQAQNIHLHSMMLVRHGHVVAEHWWKPFAPEKPHMLFSLSKSFTSTAIGLAQAENLLSVDDVVIDFFPELVTPAIRENMVDVRIRHLLSMSTGHTEDTMPFLHRAEDGNWAKAFLNVPIQKEPGTHFLYNTGATYMLSAILQRVSGQTLLDYLTPRLFQPLGISHPTWETCPQGINTGGFGLSIRTEDIAKFGELFLKRGVWRDAQLVPAEWVDTATREHISNGDKGDNDWAQGYGYQFWRCRNNAYRGDGAFGQYCVVMPDQDAVLAITSGIGDMQAVLNAVWDALLPGMSGDSSKDEDLTGDAVVDFGAAVALVGPIGLNSDLRLTPDWSDSWVTLEENPLAIKYVKFTFDAGGFSLTGKRENDELVLRGGYTDWHENTAPIRTGSPWQAVAVQGGWRDESTFVLAACRNETPFAYTVEVVRDDLGLTLKGVVNVGFGAHPEILIRGRFE